MLNHVKCPRVQYRYVYNIAANICLSLCWISLFSAQHAAAAMALEKTQFKHPTPKVKNTKNGRKYFLNFLVLDSYRIKLNTNGRILVKILRIWLSRFRAFFQLLVTISVKNKKLRVESGSELPVPYLFGSGKLIRIRMWQLFWIPMNSDSQHCFKGKNYFWYWLKLNYKCL